MSYKDFIETKRPVKPPNHALVNIWRHRYRYYVYSWRALNEPA